MHLQREGQRPVAPASTHPPGSSPPTLAPPMLPWGWESSLLTLPGVSYSGLELNSPRWKVISGVRRCVPEWTVEVCSHGGLFLQNHSKVGPLSSEPLGMGTENESPEPDYQKQFQAAVRVIQNLPKNGEGTGTCL